MPDFILECKPVKVKSDGFETGGEDTTPCHTFITLVNPDPDTAHKIVKSTLDQILLQDLCLTLESYLCYPRHRGHNISQGHV